MTSDLAPASDATVTTTSPAVEAGRDRIVVQSLVVDAFVGVHAFERLERQRLRFDVEVETVGGYAEIVRATGAYVSYADIVEFIERRAASDDHVDLVETWADDVARFALRNDLAETVRVTVTKPDIFDRANGVGVAVERRRAEPAES